MYDRIFLKEGVGAVMIKRTRKKKIRRGKHAQTHHVCMCVRFCFVCNYTFICVRFSLYVYMCSGH